jgi:monoamine oxidase
MLPLLPSAAAAVADRPVEVDVVVVGGGFSGLMSGYELQRAGLKAVVLEAKGRIGGRSRSIERKSGPGVVELGATWINNRTQPDVYSLTEKFGLETVVQYMQGDSVVQGADGRVLRVPLGAPNVSLLGFGRR